MQLPWLDLVKIDDQGVLYEMLVLVLVLVAALLGE